MWCGVLLSHCSYTCHILFFAAFGGVYHTLPRKFDCGTYKEGEGVREGAKRPTALPNLIGNRFEGGFLEARFEAGRSSFRCFNSHRIEAVAGEERKPNLPPLGSVGWSKERK
jgi:hypothetical protein